MLVKTEICFTQKIMKMAKRDGRKRGQDGGSELRMQGRVGRKREEETATKTKVWTRWTELNSSRDEET